MRHQPCFSHSESWLVYAQQKLEELPISPLKMSPFCAFFLQILVSSLLGDPQDLNCDSCIHTTWAGSVVTKTLIFTILVQAQLLGHAPTTQCTLIMVNISVLILLSPFRAMARGLKFHQHWGPY
jgi:hypothetical protein